MVGLEGRCSRNFMLEMRKLEEEELGEEIFAAQLVAINKKGAQRVFLSSAHGCGGQI
jgi:hypothetical protein